MDTSQVTFEVPHCSNNSISSDISQHNRTEELTKVCPLCQSEVRLFFVNFNEKMLMCANEECEFPFGYEELQFFKEGEDQFYSDMLSSKTAAYSEVSSEVRSEINSINQVCDQEKPGRRSEVEVQREFQEKKIKEAELQKSIQHLKSLNTELMNRTAKGDNEPVKIKNEKWIKKLKCLQDRSGFELLKPGEANSLKKEEPKLGLGELKIDFNSGNDSNIPCIRIEICNRQDNNQQQDITAGTAV